jgi:hypothetical protein
MSDVREVVHTTMRDRGMSGYISQATPVIDALVEREHGIVEDLVAFAKDKGLSEDSARRALSEAGLSSKVSAVPDRDWAASIDAVQDSINQLQGQIDSLRRR